MSKKNKKPMNPVLKKTLVTVIAIFLLMSILGGSCAGIAGRFGLKDLFPNIGFIPFYPDESKPSNSESETVKETDEESESTSGEGDQEPKPPERPAPPESIEGDVNTSGGGEEESDKEVEGGTNTGEDESNSTEGERPGESEGESESEKPGESESESELPGGNENPGESESERPGGSETPGESERPGESENPGESESESESERPGESESESTSESGSTDDESSSESFPTDVVTYPFSGLDIVNSGGTFTKEVVTIQAESSLTTSLKTKKINITVEAGYSIVKVVLNCENNSYEFTVEISPDGGIINFDGGIIEITYEYGTAQIVITFNRTVRVDEIDVSVST